MYYHHKEEERWPDGSAIDLCQTFWINNERQSRACFGYFRNRHICLIIGTISALSNPKSKYFSDTWSLITFIVNLIIESSLKFFFSRRETFQNHVQIQIWIQKIEKKCLLTWHQSLNHFHPFWWIPLKQWKRLCNQWKVMMYLFLFKLSQPSASFILIIFSFSH